MSTPGLPSHPVDRTRRPLPGDLPRVVLPPVQKTILSNGLRVWLVEQHRTPQVVVAIVIPVGGSDDPPGRSGTAALTAELLDAGTSSRDALAISESVEFIGASLSFRAGSDATFGTLLTLRRHLEAGLALFADVLVDPAFPSAEFERLRNQRLTSLIQMKDRASSVATNAFMRVLYGDDHPYGHDPSGSEASVRSLTHEAVRAFYGEHFTPRGASLIVVGDATMDDVLPLLERELGGWSAGPRRSFSQIPPPPARPARVYLIEKPGAPQAEIRIGSPALARNSADYFAATVMNRVLGGQFSSRINLNLREKRGLTYGARSAFIFLKEPGPFMVSGAFTGARTGEAAAQLLLEIGAMHREGVTDEELEFSRKGLTGGFVLGFETPFQIAGALETIILYGLPEDYFEHYIQNLAAVTHDDIRRVARAAIDPAGMAVLAVGDAHEAGKGLESLGRGEVAVLDAEGSPLQL